MKTALKILIVYIGMYLFCSGAINHCIKLYKNASVEMTDLSLCEDTDAPGQEDENETGKNEQKLLVSFSLEGFLPIYSYAEKNYSIHNEEKLSSFFSEIIPPPPKA